MRSVGRCGRGVSVAITPPSERVALILGRDEDDDDDDHHTHEIFCELEELRLPGEDGELEWKETARFVLFCNYYIAQSTRPAQGGSRGVLDIPLEISPRAYRPPRTSPPSENFPLYLGHFPCCQSENLKTGAICPYSKP